MFKKFQRDITITVITLVTFYLCFQDSNFLLTGGQDKLLRIYDLNKPEAGKHNLYVFMVLLSFNLNDFF